MRNRRIINGLLLLGVLPAVLAGCGSAGAAEERPLADAGAPFGQLPLIDEIICATDQTHEFTEFPDGASSVEQLLGQAYRVLPNTGDSEKYFAYRIGAGRGLEGGKPYVLTIEYPEDAPRSMFVLNRGGEIMRGFHTGASLGDMLYSYGNNNPESLAVPLSGESRTWSMLFYMNDRLSGLKALRDQGERPERPADGFWVLIGQSTPINDPLSAGAAVARIRLFEVPDPQQFAAKLNLPDPSLPRRHVFWREEMSNTIVQQPNPANKAHEDELDFFENRAKVMQFLGVNTYGKDLLEFGHNQGWDSGPDNSWFIANQYPDRWERILEMLGRYDFDVLPFYEYAGSVGSEGIGIRKPVMTLGGGDTYTHITWSERFAADVTEPETLDDARRLLEATIARYSDRANFIGAWFRTRPTHMPMTFDDEALAKFSAESGLPPVTREQLRADAALLDRYYGWWFDQRKAFLVALADYLRENVNPEAKIFFTADSSEQGPPLSGGNFVVTDDVPTWETLLAQPPHDERGKQVRSLDQVVAEELYLKSVLGPRLTWAEWEWQHAVPQPDPANYQDTDKVVMTYPFNRAYTVTSPAAFDEFRTPGGLAAVRFYSLNEHGMSLENVGYFVADVDYAGPYSMMPEALAMAHGDPQYLGYLAGALYNRAFPQYVRNFNAAFLSLPALPSRLDESLSSDAEVFVRVIETPEHGTYLAVVNTALEAKQGVTITLPTEGSVTDAATGEAIVTEAGQVSLDMYACQLRAIRIR